MRENVKDDAMKVGKKMRKQISWKKYFSLIGFHYI